MTIHDETERANQRAMPVVAQESSFPTLGASYFSHHQKSKFQQRYHHCRQPQQNQRKEQKEQHLTQGRRRVQLLPQQYVLVAVLAVFLLFSPSVESALSCNTDQDCREALREGSFCVDGSCSNPFVQGCLKTMMMNHSRGRICNTDDILAGSQDCMVDSNFQYPQLRIHNGNWESSIFLSWIFQIILMEVLDVPVTVGLKTEVTAASGFYSPQNTLEYSAKAYPFDSLDGATNCHSHNEECSQVLPEVWNGQYHEWTEALNNGIIEPVEGNGQVGKGSWYVPAFTALDDFTLVSFYGLQGERNRKKLADAFRRPTTWEEYCEEVSEDNCTTADTHAQSYPETASDRGKYYAPPGYIGYFRLTDANNCTVNEDTCMGHIVGPGCTWSTNVDGQLFWNDIRLKPDGPLAPNGGYAYSSLIEIWRAANATRSGVVFWWWKPEALVEEYRGTDGQFQQVLLPEATDVCSRSRVDTDARCSDDITVRRGSPLGACDQEAHALQKVFSKAWVEESKDAELANKSPALDFIKAVKITDLEINNMLRRWLDMGVDPYGNDAREAVCSWVVENFDRLVDFIPEGYPRQLSKRSSYNSPLLHFASTVAILCSCAVCVVAGLAYYWRKSKVFVFAQAHIVFMILVGFLFITIGSVLTTMEPTNPKCIASAWFVNLGYTIQFVPLLVKISAINKILSSAQKLRRVKISPQRMMAQVGVVIVVMILYLLIWTLVDPVQSIEQRNIESYSDSIVETHLTCSSQHGFWTLIGLGWQVLLLVMATALAFQSKDIIQEFNESQSLGTMIYSHFLFVCLRVIMYFLVLNDIFIPSVASGLSSLLLSMDTFFAMIIYLVPKCYEAKVAPDNYRKRLASVPSKVITAIEQRAAEAKAQYLSARSNTASFQAESFRGESFFGDESKSTLGMSGRRGSSKQSSKKIFGIDEVSCESASEDLHPQSVSAPSPPPPPPSSEAVWNGEKKPSPPPRRVDAAGHVLVAPDAPSTESEKHQQMPSRSDDGDGESDGNEKEDSLEFSSLVPVKKNTRGAGGGQGKDSTGEPKRSTFRIRPLPSGKKPIRSSSSSFLPARPSLDKTSQSLRIDQLERPYRSSFGSASGGGGVSDVDDDDLGSSTSSSDEFDSGGPRFPNERINEEMKRSIRMSSQADFDFDTFSSMAGSDDDDDIMVDSNDMSIPLGSNHNKFRSSRALSVLPEENEESSSQRSMVDENFSSNNATSLLLQQNENSVV